MSEKVATAEQLIDGWELVVGLEVHVERMRHNLGLLHGVVFSQSVLLALVEGGMTRDEAYRIVQDDARTALESGRPFEDVLRGDSRVPLGDSELASAFDLDRVLRHAGDVVDTIRDLT